MRCILPAVDLYSDNSPKPITTPSSSISQALRMPPIDGQREQNKYSCAKQLIRYLTNLTNTQTSKHTIITYLLDSTKREIDLASDSWITQFIYLIHS